MTTNPAVFVFLQEGCPACTEFKPRIMRLAHPYRSRGYPIGFYDLAQRGPATRLGNGLGIKATPTTVVMDSAGRLQHHVGAITDAVITKLLRHAFGG